MELRIYDCVKYVRSWSVKYLKHLICDHFQIKFFFSEVTTILLLCIHYYEKCFKLFKNIDNNNK